MNYKRNKNVHDVMNIFFLHYITRKCARYHCNSHCIKMILETAQLLCSAIHMSGGDAVYKLTHKNHPCAIWVRSSRTNWLWAKDLGLELCKEYTYRYSKTHKTQSIIEDLECPDLPDIGFTTPPQAMPDEYKAWDSITAYRTYYLIGKKHLHTWKKRKIPTFITSKNPVNDTGMAFKSSKKHVEKKSII